MIDPHDFAQKQLELTGEFGKYLFDHPEVDERVPEGTYIFFQVEGEAGFNSYSRSLAERKAHEDNMPIILVRMRGSRSLDPVIEAGAIR